MLCVALGPVGLARNTVLTLPPAGSRIFEKWGGGVQLRSRSTLLYKQKRGAGGGANIGPNIKKPTSWAKKGGRPFLARSSLAIFKTMILPYLDYGDILFSTANRQKLDKLQRLQNKCLKICLNVH